MAKTDHTISSLIEHILKIRDEYGDIPVVINGHSNSFLPFFVQLHGSPKVVRVSQDSETEFFYPGRNISEEEGLDKVVCVLKCEEAPEDAKGKSLYERNRYQM